ncbi:MAG: flagellar hook-basal body protein [Bacillota bacterium]|uniref:Flagellar hook-basal body protein n=1 Tax=Virgibacillus salarius TaxID=447199 RepID=A0A941DYE4_9BACI|nr:MULTISPECIES: flagellar hook-basal body protein [Bacillaceae]MBR7795668.1 flagellar hook-basal body protein [Virgibacillus salarius]MDY7046461.1 flagellar hook-basal body protein [Virgibacillus sp. M23]NAZ08381.1 flagellar hook-basal body complex protein [Agaribacter marinus]
MSRTMIQAAVTMNQLQNKLDLIGNNMANSQTTGFKSRQADFSSLLFQQMNNMTDPANAEGRLTPDGLRIGAGAKLGSTNINLSQGTLTETERALDTALLGENHFYQVQVVENGVTETRYTRDGAFYLSPMNNDQEVMLTNSDGSPILGVNGPILIEEGFDDIAIQPNGQIEVRRGNQTEVVGRLAIVEAVRPRLLEATGNNEFKLPNLNELGFNFGEIIQNVGDNESLLKSGALEMSNVDISKEMSDLIMTQRSYQFNARTISMSDQMSGLVNQLR